MTRGEFRATGSLAAIFAARLLGLFMILVGGAAGGLALAAAGPQGLLGCALILALLWLPVAVTMRPPGQYSSTPRLAPGGEPQPGTLAARLEAMPGVVEADEGVVHLKVDRRRFDSAAAARIVGG